MEKRVMIGAREVAYTLRRSLRARRVRITVRPDGSIVLTVPVREREDRAEEFLLRHAAWLTKTVERLARTKHQLIPRHTLAEYRDYKQQALALALLRLQFFNHVYAFKVGRVSIRRQKTRWGSCSRRGNLSFNYRILFLPTELVDYVIVHELCHRGAMNHSSKFWQLVAKAVPDYAERRRRLRAWRMVV